MIVFCCLLDFWFHSKKVDLCVELFQGRDFDVASLFYKNNFYLDSRHLKILKLNACVENTNARAERGRRFWKNSVINHKKLHFRSHLPTHFLDRLFFSKNLIFFVMRWVLFPKPLLAHSPDSRNSTVILKKKMMN